MPITVKTYQEFKELIDGKKIEISKMIVKAILCNLDTNKKSIFISHVNVSDEDVSYELTLNKKDFIDFLKKNLEIHEKYEEYEVCSQIIKAIQYLESKKSLA